MTEYKPGERYTFNVSVQGENWQTGTVQQVTSCVDGIDILMSWDDGTEVTMHTIEELEEWKQR